MSSELRMPEGFAAGAVACGVKPRSDRLDLGLLLADEAFPIHALFTRNELLGAHIPVCRDKLLRSGGVARAVLCNSGNANCATGEQGLADARRISAELADKIGCPEEQVLILSTGVIGAMLPTEKMLCSLPALLAQAQAPSARRAEGLQSFAKAIMTTDTVPKLATGACTAEDGSTMQVCGVAKGSGMIHPDMATMLAVVLSEGTSPGDLGFGLRAIADRSFHRCSVDGDTSPNDTLLLWNRPGPWCRPDADGPLPLEAAIEAVSQDLARQIAADGEGASRLVTVEIRGAQSEDDVTTVGRAIAVSPLCKTAIAGRDPNWGRFLSAAATAGRPIDVARARVWVGEFIVYSEGRPHPEVEAAASDYLAAEREVKIGVDLAKGPFDGEVWTCDLTADYVSINADYRS